MIEEDNDYADAVGMFIGLAGPIIAAGLLVGVRGEIVNANVALVLMIVVVLAAAIGGRRAGLLGAIVATASYDFFHTQPYNSLRITSSDDVETAILLLIAGLLVGEIAARARVARAAAEAGRSELRRIHRLAELAAQGASRDELITSATTDLTQLLTLEDCRYETPPYDVELERLERSGIVIPPKRLITTMRMGREGFELSPDGVELPVLHRGEEVGRFKLVPTPGVGASLEQKIVAVALADQVGAALESGSSTA